jgi:AmmeMemoRadiSam system protein B
MQFAPSVTDEPSVATITEPPTIAGVVVPHHEIVAHERRAVLQAVADQTSAPTALVILSPNHFVQGDAAVVTTDRTWNLSSGQRSVYRPLLDDLRERGIALDDQIFDREHGVPSVLADAAAAFPGVPVLPLIIDEAATQSQRAALATMLAQRCPTCLLVASVDFSHDQPPRLAQLHDVRSIRALRSCEQDAIRMIEVDSRAVLSVTCAYATQRGASTFTLLSHTNSGLITEDPHARATTHVMGYFGPQQDNASSTVAGTTTLMFGGDVMLGRCVGHRYGADLSQVFSELGRRFFWGVDAAVVNLEGPISDHAGAHTCENTFSFLFAPEVPDLLREHYLTHVSLANNHALDDGWAGYERTRELLGEVGVTPVGAPRELSEASVARIEGPEPVALLALHTLYGTPEGIPERISELSEEGYAVVVFPHWGEEYQREPSSRQRALARAWVAAGADLIIGAHPHVLQEVEVIDGVPVLYSLGNLVFDQEFREDTQVGAVAGVGISSSNVSLTLVPIRIERSVPRVWRDNAGLRFLTERTDLWESFRRDPANPHYVFPRPREQVLE